MSATESNVGGGAREARRSRGYRARTRHLVAPTAGSQGHVSGGHMSQTVIQIRT